MSNEPIANQPLLYINNMIPSWGSNTTLSVTAGQARDSTNVYDIDIAATTTVNAAVNGLNGLDTGALAASKVYAIMVIGDTAGFRPSGYMLTLTPSAPLLPFGYGMYRQIGWWATDSSSHFLLGYVSQGIQGLHSFYYDAPQATAITAGAATSYTLIDLTALVPAVDNTPVYVLGKLTPNAANDTLQLQPAGATGNAITIAGQVTTVAIYDQFKMLAKISSSKPQISYKVSAGSDAAAVSILGFDYSL